MNSQEMNLEFVGILNEWDPFAIGEGNYDTEIADCIQALHVLNNENILAEQIQSIYEFSFEERIPYDQCLGISRELIKVKNSGSCSF